MKEQRSWRPERAIDKMLNPHEQLTVWLVWYSCHIFLLLWNMNIGYVNALAPRRSKGEFENVIINLALLIGIFKCSYDNVFIWVPQNLKSTLVQVMAWCRQATSHYLNQCWPRSPTPCGVTRPQLVNHLMIILNVLRYHARLHHYPIYSSEPFLFLSRLPTRKRTVVSTLFTSFLILSALYKGDSVNTLVIKKFCKCLTPFWSWMRQTGI